jgi:Protein of unknown function (DUF669)
VVRRIKVARVTVDFSEVPDFDPMPKGDYAVLVDKLEYRVAQEADKYDYINWELVVTEDGEFNNRRLWFITSLSPRALFRLKDILENLGLYEDELEIDYDEDSMLVTSPEVVGMPAMATVTQRPYEGRIQNDVAALTSMDGAQKKGAKTTSRRPAAKKTTTRKPAAKSASRKFK